MKIDKKISVIIPIYNAEKYLKQTLDSVRFQTYKNLEIICVLDCPTDKSAEIVDEASKKDKRIKSIKLSENIGQANARNIGIQNAAGEYMHFMDGDDFISDNFYESMTDAIIAADADVAACCVFYEKKAEQSVWFAENEVLFGNDKIKKTEVTIHGWACQYLIKRNFWDNSHLSFPNLIVMENIAVMIPMIYYANKVALCPNAVYFYKDREYCVPDKKVCGIDLEILQKEHRLEAEKRISTFMRTRKIKRYGRRVVKNKRKAQKFFDDSLTRLCSEQAEYARNAADSENSGKV